MRCGIFRISHSEDSDVSPSGPERLQRESLWQTAEADFKTNQSVLVFFFLPLTYFCKATTAPSNLKSSPASVTSSSKSLWHFFFSFPYSMFLKKEREKTFLPHITLLSQFQCRLLCWVVASNASVSAKNCQMQITHKNACSKTVPNNGWKCKFSLYTLEKKKHSRGCYLLKAQDRACTVVRLSLNNYTQPQKIFRHSWGRMEPKWADVWRASQSLFLKKKIHLK